MAPLKKLPGVLSFQRGLVLSDGLFYNRRADGTRTPLSVVRHGIRGTQNTSNLAATTAAGATAVSARRVQVSNIQQTDSAKLSADAVALEVEFSIRFLDLSNALFACAPGKDQTADDVAAVRDAFGGFVRRAKDGAAVDTLARRYARNLANARFAWRNRMTAETVTVQVTVHGQATPLAKFDALAVPLTHFDDITADEQRVADVIARGLQGHRDATLLVQATLTFGMGTVEVFPSQNYIEDKPAGFARPLYCVGHPPLNQAANHPQQLGQAALRDQKIGNAVRTIDTWYPEYVVRKLPIPVEPNGASLDAQQFFRATVATSGFYLLKQMPTLDPASDDGQFVLACLIRGGVFSGGD